MPKRAKERWKTIHFPAEYEIGPTYQISNYGRVRNILKDGSFRVKRFKIIRNTIMYRFLFKKENSTRRHVYHVKANHLVAQAFKPDYQKGKFVLWKNHNRFDNYVGNLICLDESDGRKHIAQGIKLKVPQQFTFAEEEQATTESHRVEVDIDYFKEIPDFPIYEVNRKGVVRRRKNPFKGRIISQRKHPDGLFIMDLRDNNKNRKTAYPHRLVAEVWCINPDPEKFTEVMHLDGNRRNNNAENLLWTTKSEALKHDFALGKRDNRKSWKTRKKLYGNGFKKSVPASI